MQNNKKEYVLITGGDGQLGKTFNYIKINNFNIIKLNKKKIKYYFL